MGAKPLKESRSAQLLFIWSYQQIKGLLFHLRGQTHSTSKIGSATDTQEACANYSTTATNDQDAHTDSLASIVNDNADSLTPANTVAHTRSSS
jgi:hypothetical protein